VYLPKTTLSPAVATPTVVTGHVGTETILLVEDETGVRAFVKITLERFGYHVIEADTAEAALTLLNDYAPPVHLLLTDVVLPGMDGIELARQVTDQRPSTRVLYMTGYAPGVRTVPGALNSSIHLLEKPFTAQALVTKTRQLLGIHSEQIVS
jgi:DNA-binding NtrC family response regulator